MKRKNILKTLGVGALCLTGALAFAGCDNNKVENQNINQVVYNYEVQGYNFKELFEENTIESSTVVNGKISGELPNVKQEYQEYFIGWFNKDNDEQITKDSSISTNITVVIKFDTTKVVYNAVLSDSMSPTLKTGDLAIYDKTASECEVGDIVLFNYNDMPTSHRIIAIVEKDGEEYYVCHGDNGQSLDGTSDDTWQANAAVLEGKSYDDIVNDPYTKSLTQVVSKDSVVGKLIFVAHAVKD